MLYLVLKNKNSLKAVLKIFSIFFMSRFLLLATGFNKFEHLQLAELGMEKCSSPVTEKNIGKVVAKGRGMIVG